MAIVARGVDDRPRRYYVKDFQPNLGYRFGSKCNSGHLSSPIKLQDFLADRPSLRRGAQSILLVAVFGPKAIRQKRI